MIHTVRLFYQFDLEEINSIQTKYGSLKSCCTFLQSSFPACKATFDKKYITNFYLVVDLIKILKTSTIKDDDYSTISNYINKFLSPINLLLDDMTLTRIDYREDFYIPDCNKRSLILSTISKSSIKYKFKNRKYLGTSLYFSSHSTSIILYDKESERISKGRKIEEYEKGILRLEVRILNKRLNSNKHKKGIPKKLPNYFKESIQKDYIRKELSGIIFYGNFHRLNDGVDIILNSNLSNKDKNFVLQIYTDYYNKTLDEIKKNLSYYKLKKYFKILKTLNIYPLGIYSDFNKIAIMKVNNPFNVFL